MSMLRDRVYRLALRRRSPRQEAATAPTLSRMCRSPRASLNLSSKSHRRAPGRSTSSQQLVGQVKRAVLDGSYDEADSLYRASPSSTAPPTSEAFITEASWWAGVGAYARGDYVQALELFSAVYFSDSDADLRAAGAYWSSRVMLRLHRPEESDLWLERALESPWDFYGQLAASALGQPIAGIEEWPSLEAAGSFDAARRALALMQIERREQALAEVRRFIFRLPAESAVVWLSVLNHAGMVPESIAYAEYWRARHGLVSLSALFPSPQLSLPDEGLRLDLPLLYAFIRRESRFREDAKSHAGARGLMQIMPITARFVAGGAVSKQDLFEPSTNVSLGQRYLELLLNSRDIEGNLIYAAIAYNAGPANLKKILNKESTR